MAQFSESKQTPAEEELRRQSEVLKQQLTRMNLLNQITRAVAERQDLVNIFRITLKYLEDDLPIDIGTVFLFDPQQGTVTVTAHGPKGEQLTAELGLSEGAIVSIEQTGFSGCVEGETVSTNNMAQVDAPIPRKLLQAGIQSGVMVPLVVESKVLGILAVGRREVNGFSAEEIKFLRVLSEHVALAAYNARLYQDLQKAYDDLRKTQQEAMQHERLRALGQMASGIAHDINNALSPIAVYTDLLLATEMNLSNRARKFLETTKTASEDIAQIVARMREFYRKRGEQDVLFPLNMNQVVKQVVTMTRPRWKDIPQEKGIAIDLQTDLQNNLPSMMGIESEIREALVNLVFNAVDAMPHDGVITLRTRTTAENIVVEVADTGTGMDEETRQHCLEPFYSTKGELGTGLGLAVVFGVMQRHGGNIEIESNVGQGTRVRLKLPLRQAAEAGAIVSPKASALLPPLRILYIDDEPSLRESMKETLQNDGHTVTVADGGQAGVDTFVAAKARGEPFDLVITDLGMPHMDGREVAKQVKSELPTTVVILLTGWGARLKAEGDMPVGVDCMLSKPPQIGELRKALARITRPSR
ncbi:MAG: response regulator [Candidatus Tectomicrobia bacterium]|nr:response regulator [Candidatus Tectomicrobia bacterium]